MDYHDRGIFLLLTVSSLLCFQSRADSTGTVFFIDAPKHQYLRSPSPNDVVQSHSMLLSEVGAAVSVLLGFAPPDTLSESGSSKLNEVLMPNPFNRPLAVFMLEVRGVDADPKFMVKLDNTRFSDAYSSKISPSSNKVDIQLPDEDEVSLIFLDEQLEDCAEKEIHDFASWLGGSYVADASEPLNGELTFPLSNNINLNLHMSKKAEREFTLSLLALFHNMKRAMEMHEAQSMLRSAELMMGCFDGIKVLQDQIGPEGVAQKGMELLLVTLSKIFDSLQTSYKGQIVGVILFNRSPSSDSETVLNLMSTSSLRSLRLLGEVEGGSINATTVAEIVLVRWTLAWLTGIILIIATLLGIYFLLNMPLTRDTLLYSNVKLD